MILVDLLKKASNFKTGGLLLLGLAIVLVIFSGCNKVDDNNGGTGGIIHSQDPKGVKIESRDIVSFEYEFSTNSIFYRGSGVPYRYCEFYMHLEDDLAQVKINLDDYDFTSYEFQVPKEKLLALQDLIEKENISSQSGRYHEVAGIPEQHGARLSVKYASDESIYASDNTGHVMPNISSAHFYDFFRNLAIEAGQEDFASKDDRPITNQEYERIARGNWIVKDGAHTLEFNGNELKISQGNEVLYEGDFTIQLGIFINDEGRLGFGPIDYLYIMRENIVAKSFHHDDIEFSPGEGYYLEMVQGSWSDTEGKYKLLFEADNLKVYEDEELVLDDEIYFEYGSIYLKDGSEKEIGPFRNLNAQIGNVEVYPYVGESEDNRITFYPTKE